ncbi:MAG: M48 family metalloprotease [Burkholderiales bacterium]
MHIRLPFIILLALALGACETPAPPRPIPVAVAPAVVAPPPPVNTAELAAHAAALRELAALQDRLYRVAAPLLVNNPALCKRNARNLLGFTAKNKYSYSSEFVDSAQKILGLGEQLQIMGVMPGSGAASAGVQSGDKLVSVNDMPLPQGQNAEHLAGLVLAPLLTERTPITLTINRDGADILLKIPLTHACAFGVELGNTDSVNAYADGHRVMVTRGMMHAAGSDEELAYILATEMAHNILGHATKQHTSATIAGIIDKLTQLHPDLSNFDNLAPIKSSTQELDMAADKLGLYMAARAGYGVENAAPFWSRLATQYPPTVLNSYTAIHPATDYRLSAIAKVTVEIKARQAARKPLTPTNSTAYQSMPPPSPQKTVKPGNSLPLQFPQDGVPGQNAR